MRFANWPSRNCPERSSCGQTVTLTRVTHRMLTHVRGASEPPRQAALRFNDLVRLRTDGHGAVGLCWVHEIDIGHGARRNGDLVRLDTGGVQNSDPGGLDTTVAQKSGDGIATRFDAT